MPRRQHQVVIQTRGGPEHARKLKEIEGWLREWSMSCNLSGSEAHRTIRAAFRSEGHARALELQYGGRRLSGAELDAALAEDEIHDALINQARKGL